MDFDFTLPGLGRPASSRPQRVAEAIKNELSLLLIRDIADPGLSGVSISEVRVSPDIKQARISFMVPAGQDASRAVKAMNRAKGFFRSHLAKTLNLRYTPELSFFLDTLNQELDRMDALFRSIEEERRHGTD